MVQVLGKGWMRDTYEKLFSGAGISRGTTCGEFGDVAKLMATPILLLIFKIDTCQRFIGRLTT